MMIIAIIASLFRAKQLLFGGLFYRKNKAKRCLLSTLFITNIPPSVFPFLSDYSPPPPHFLWIYLACVYVSFSSCLYVTSCIILPCSFLPSLPIHPHCLTVQSILHNWLFAFTTFLLSPTYSFLTISLPITSSLLHYAFRRNCLIACLVCIVSLPVPSSLVPYSFHHHLSLTHTILTGPPLIPSPLLIPSSLVPCLFHPHLFLSHFILTGLLLIPSSLVPYSFLPHCPPDYSIFTVS